MKLFSQSNYEVNLTGAWEDRDTGGTLVFTEDGRYFSYNGDELNDYGSIRLNDRQRRITLFSTSGTSEFKVDNATENTLSLEGTVTVFDCPVELDMELTRLHQAVKPPIAQTISDAAVYGDVEAMKKFLAENPDLDAVDDKGDRPIERAAYSTYNEPLKLLLEAGANPNLVSSNGHTPLILAVEAQNKQNVKMLIEAGANVNYKMKPEDSIHPAGDSVYSIAAMGDSLDILKLVVEHLDNPTNEKILSEAMSGFNQCEMSLFEKYDFTEFLLDKGNFHLDKPSGGEPTPLFIAVAQSLVKTIPLLIKHGADVNYKLDGGVTPIGYAFMQASRETTNGVNGIEKPKFLKTIRIMKKYGADLNVQFNDEDGVFYGDVSGITPLHIAVKAGALKTVKLLLELGVDPSIQDSDGKTAFMYAEHPPYGKEYSSEMVDLFKAYHADVVVESAA